jgi:hypothetical protein
MKTVLQFWRRWHVREDVQGQGETRCADTGSYKERPKLGDELHRRFAQLDGEEKGRIAYRMRSIWRRRSDLG